MYPYALHIHNTYMHIHMLIYSCMKVYIHLSAIYALYTCIYETLLIALYIFFIYLYTHACTSPRKNICIFFLGNKHRVEGQSNFQSCYIIITFFVFFFFLGLHLWHMEVPRLHRNWKCQFPGWIRVGSHQSTLQPQQHQIQAMSANYTATHSNSRSLNHWARPGIEPASSWILLGFITAEPRQQLPQHNSKMANIPNGNQKKN